MLTYYTNGDGQDPTNEVRIPIISDLSCVINVPEKIWRMVIGKLVQMELLPK